MNSLEQIQELATSLGHKTWVDEDGDLFVQRIIPADFTFTVTVTCNTLADAEQVIADRLGPEDKDSPFDYKLDWSTVLHVS